MKRLPEIQINPFQLALLLDDEQKSFYNSILVENVFCTQCKGIAIKGIVIEEIFLTDLNDIMVRGTCNVCESKVARNIEFGADNAFYKKALKFRNTVLKDVQKKWL
jgi:hypothetical protein